jgi:hypothetical protein
MSIRTALTGAGTWSQIGTGPATVQLLVPDANGAEVMVEAAAAEPTGTDGMVLSAAYPVHHFSLVQAIWAQVVQAGLTAVVAVQPEAS